MTSGVVPGTGDAGAGAVAPAAATRAPAAPAPGGAGRVARLRAGPSGWIRARPALRRTLSSQPALLAGLTVVAALYTVAAVFDPLWFPIATAGIWILIGGFFLRLQYLLVYFGVLTAAIATATRLRQGPSPTPGVVVTLAVIGFLVLLYARDRERVGVQGALGASMLVDLRDRLRAQGTVPPLGPGWVVDTELRAAYGDSFSGDFLVASRSVDGGWLEIVLVDVSGKGQPAGTRALLLSGAFGGLLGAMPRGRFLSAANRYVLHQNWDEGFATAVHVAVELATGVVEVRSAGHPPAAHYHRGSGRWDLVRAGQGPLLGVLPAVEFPVHSTRLEHGDALMIYTDGLVEDRDRDIALGIDRLVGVAEQVLTAAPAHGGAVRIVEASRTAGDDDRALVLIRRI